MRHLSCSAADGLVVVPVRALDRYLVREIARIVPDAPDEARPPARLRADRAQHQLAAAATSRAEAETESGRLATELVQLRVRMIVLDDRLRSSIRGGLMTYRIAILLFMLWLLGLVYAYTMGGLIHVLPVIARRGIE